MNKGINTVLFYLAEKNYYTGVTEIKLAVDSQIDIERALAKIEALALADTKIDTDNTKAYLLKQYVKDGMRNLPLEFTLDPYRYFEQLYMEKQRIILQHRDYVGKLATQNASGTHRRERHIWKRTIKWIAGILAAVGIR